MADTLGLGPSARKGVEVQVLSSAPARTVVLQRKTWPSQQIYKASGCRKNLRSNFLNSFRQLANEK